MRGSFNREMTVRYGSRSTAGPPGVTYASGISCRRVLQERIAQGQFDFAFAHHWVTQDTVVLNPPSVISPWLGALFTDQLTADEVSFDDAPTVWYSVCRHESVHPEFGADYWRDLLIPLSSIVYPVWPPPNPLPPPPPPPPPPPAPPGDSCSDPELLVGVGEYILSAFDLVTPGFYSVVVPADSPLRVYLLEGGSGSNIVIASLVSLGGECCDATTWATLFGAEGACEDTVTPPTDVGSWKLCLQVVYSGLEPVPEPLGVGIALEPCG